MAQNDHVTEGQFIEYINEAANQLNNMNSKVDNIQKITAFNWKGNKDTYADLLLLTDLELNDGYGVIADGLVYVWNGTSFPAEGDGLNVSMKPIGEVEESNTQAVSGGEVFDYVSKTALIKKQLIPTTTPSTAAYKVDRPDNKRTEWFATGADSRTLLKFSENFQENDKVQIDFESMYSDLILFVNSDRMVLLKYVLSATEKAAKTAIINVPKGTQSVYFSVAVADIPNSKLFYLPKGNPVNTSLYKYLAFQNKMITANITNGKKLEYNGSISSVGIGFNLIEFMPVVPGKLFFYGVNFILNGGIFFYDKNKQVVSKLAPSELTYNLRNDTPTIWDMKMEIIVPERAVYISFSTDLNGYTPLNGTDVYNAPIDKMVVWQDVNILKDDDSIKKFSNNLQTQKRTAGSLLNFNSDISTRNKKIAIDNTSINKVGRVAFRFRINEDLNIGTASEKKILEIISADGTKFFNLVANLGATSNLVAKDIDHSNANFTTYPIPKFNSGFGVRTNITEIAEARRNINYPNRSFSALDVTNKHYKPICGDDLFWLRFTSTDQTTLNNWLDLRFISDDTKISLGSTNNGLNISSNYADFTTIIELYNDFKGKVNASVLSDKIEFYAYNLGSFKPSDPSSVNNARNSDLWIEPSDVLQINVPLISTYYNTNLAANHLDSYPVYVSRKIDRSWHTMEFISDNNLNTCLFTIDGQWLSDVPNFDFPNARSVWENGGRILIGSELQIDVKDLTVEFESYSNVEAMDIGLKSHVFASDYHPNIIHFFGHDLYYLQDPDIDILEFDKFQKYISEGGFIPDELKPLDPLYKGDDGTVPIYRKHLAHPSFKLEQLFMWLKNAGYTNISYKQLGEYKRNGVPLPSNKCFLIDFDDTPTYIYDDLKLRSIFKRYSVRPSFALELGYYVDENTPTSYGASSFIASVNDTNTHRLELQKRVRNLEREGWGVIIHGEKDGYYHKGRSYLEMKNANINAIEIANYLGFDSQYWCLAASGSTPNSVKLQEHYGIILSTSTIDTYVGSCHLPTYSPRVAWETGAFRQPQVQLARIIGDNIK